MKTKLLLLIALFSTLSYAQTLNWENATVSSGNIAFDNENNIDYYFYASNYSQLYVSGDGVFNSQGISGKAVYNSQPMASVYLDFSEEIDVQSLKVLGLDNGTRNWIFKPSRGVGEPIVASINHTSATTVTLNWTNVTRIEISVEDPQNLGLALSYMVDTITFSAATPCNISIPDANFKAVLVSDNAINYNYDSEISCAEATSYTGDLDVHSEYISDLSGIENFKNITFLNIGGNNLTSIDLSNNLALETLFCYSNSLVSLDVSNNTELNGIACQNNGQLTTLNVANGNNINITNDNFVAFGTPNLNCIKVDNVAYSDANWTNIDSQTSFSVNCAALSVDEFSLNTVSLYPNPATSTLNIKMPQHLFQATIYSVLGTEVLNKNPK